GSCFTKHRAGDIIGEVRRGIRWLWSSREVEVGDGFEEVYEGPVDRRRVRWARLPLRLEARCRAAGHGHTGDLYPRLQRDPGRPDLRRPRLLPPRIGGVL
ncbi:MAG: hypothetical protein AVDCRST_MAG25-2203, partial [uncultured Rubrobacteraceae bacterium]